VLLTLKLPALRILWSRNSHQTVLLFKVGGREGGREGRGLNDSCNWFDSRKLIFSLYYSLQLTIYTQALKAGNAPVDVQKAVVRTYLLGERETGRCSFPFCFLFLPSLKAVVLDPLLSRFILYICLTSHHPPSLPPSLPPSPTKNRPPAEALGKKTATPASISPRKICSRSCLE